MLRYKRYMKHEWCGVTIIKKRLKWCVVTEAEIERKREVVMEGRR